VAEQSDKHSKTQEATLKKLLDARKKGDVASSREAGSAILLFSLIALVLYVLPNGISAFTATLASAFHQSHTYDLSTDLTGLAELRDLLSGFTFNVMLFLAQVFGVLAIGAVIGILLQGDIVFSSERLRPKLSKISPASGFKRVYSAQAFIEFLKNATKVMIVGVVAVWVSYLSVRQVAQGLGMMPEGLPAFLLDAVQKLLTYVTAIMVPFAIADGLWQRFQWRKKQMMSLQEVRDEMKESDGDPKTKAKRAAIRHERSKTRLIHILPKASVVITNPTHFAVALRYDRLVDIAPICIAKGADAMALRIREIAGEYDVPVVENKAVARALYKAVEVDDIVPVDHWEIVAEIIRYLDTLGTSVNSGSDAPEVLGDRQD
jgi:flagellar biosynthetic protein FlhB